MATQHDVVQVSDLANHCAGELGSGELGSGELGSGAALFWGSSVLGQLCSGELVSGELGSGELGSGELGSGAARFCGSSVLLVLCYTIHFRHAHNLDNTMSR